MTPRPTYQCEVCSCWHVLAMVAEVRPAAWVCLPCLAARDRVRDAHANRTSTRALSPAVHELVDTFRRLRGAA